MIADLFKQIESSNFDVAISAESSVRRILKVLNSQKSVVKLIDFIRKDHQMAEVVLSRIARLAGTSVDYRYRNKHDVALAAYFYIIMASAPQLFGVAARLVLGAPNTWLTQQLVNLVLNARGGSIALATQPYSFVPASFPNLANPNLANTWPTTSGGFTVDTMQIAPVPAAKGFVTIDLANFDRSLSANSSEYFNWESVATDEVLPRLAIATSGTATPYLPNIQEKNVGKK
jgi:hypothetical protein